MIRVFYKPNCKACLMTMHFFIVHHIKFIDIDLSQSPQYAKSLHDKGHLKVPVVITDTEEWSGFRPDNLNQLLQKQRLMRVER